MAEQFMQNVLVLGDHPESLFALLAVLVLLVAGISFRRVRLTTGMLINIALMVALTVLLHQIRLYHFPQGGAVTLGSMVPLVLVAFRYGTPVGALAGFLYGFFNLMQDPFLLHPVQVLFDYPLPFMAMGLAGLFPKRRMLSVAVAFFARFLSHFISGVVFFASYAPEGTSPVLYSLVVNGSILLPEFLICCAILHFLPIQKLLSAMDRRSAP